MNLNKNMKILLYAANLRYLGEGMLGPLLALFTERIGGDILDISWAWSIYLIVGGICFIIVGKITDKYDNKKEVMVLGYALNALFTFGYLLVSTQLHLFIIQAGLGIAASLATPTRDSLYAKYEDTKNDGMQWGLAGGLKNIITGIAILLGGYIVVYGSFVYLFIIMGTIQTIAALYQARILREK